MTTDRLFKEPVARAAQNMAPKSTSPVYFYEFAYRGKYSLADRYVVNSEGLGKQQLLKNKFWKPFKYFNYRFIFRFTGVSHGDDLMYVVKTEYGNPHDNVEDAKLIPVMVNMWSSFAKTGCVSSIEWNTWVLYLITNRKIHKGTLWHLINLR